MATDKTAVWSDGDVCLWYTPTTGIDVFWLDGDVCLFDEYSIYFIASGRLDVAFSAAKPGAAFTSAAPSVAFSSKKPSITFEGE